VIEKILAAGKIQRPFLFESGHACVANSEYVVWEIRVDKKLHGTPLGVNDVVWRGGHRWRPCGSDYTSRWPVSQKI
jgi:hypothetical protein